MGDISRLNRPAWGRFSANYLLFYLAVPVFLGVVFAGLTYPTLKATKWPVALVQAYSVSIVFFGWLIRDAFCAVVARLSRRKSLPLATVLIFGGFIGNLVVFPFNIAFQTGFEKLFVGDILHTAHTRWPALLQMDAAFVSEAIWQHILPALFLWTVTNLFFFHVLGFPRYGYPTSRIYTSLSRPTEILATERLPAPGVEAHANSRPSFMKLLPTHRQNENVVALKAEQHYVRVFVEGGENLIHERFRSVIGEFERFGGIQVHRSFAIHPSSIERVESEDGATIIAMSNGLRVPVSRSYLAVAKKLRASLALSAAE